MKKDTHKSLGRKNTFTLNKFTDIKLFYISVAMLIFAILLLGTAIVIEKKSHKPIVTPHQGYAQNTPVTMGLVTMTVNSISFSDGQPGFNAPPDQHYAIIGFTVKNNSDKPIDVFPSSDIYAKDQAGSVTYLTPYALKKPFHAGSLLAGEQVNGELSFIVPKMGPVKIYVDAIWSGGVVPFKVQ